jgi:hypothetical protein
MNMIINLDLDISIEVNADVDTDMDMDTNEVKRPYRRESKQIEAKRITNPSEYSLTKSLTRFNSLDSE